MGRREDIKKHHTIRHTHDAAPRRKISIMLLLMLIVAAAMGVNVLSTRPIIPGGDVMPMTAIQPQPTAPPPTREQLLETASMIADGQWGAELLDNCTLMGKGFGASGDNDAADYAAMLANGSEPSDNSDKLIAAIALDDAQTEIYRTALLASYQNRLRKEKSK